MPVESTFSQSIPSSPRHGGKPASMSLLLTLACLMPVTGASATPKMKMVIFNQPPADQNRNLSIPAPPMATSPNGALKMVIFDTAHPQSAAGPAAPAPTDYRGGPTAPPPSSEPPPNYQMQGYLSAGYRHDDLHWDIAAPGGTPNVLSELQWNNIESVAMGGGIEINFANGWHGEGQIHYGVTVAGQNQDSDYFSDNRMDEFSRSNNASDSGAWIDLSAAFGYNIDVAHPDFPLSLRLTPKFGYGFQTQQFRMKDGYQTIPATGSFSGLDSSYDASWYGPFLGASARLGLSTRLSLQGNFDYHWVNYDGTGNWNLRDDFQQPTSFEHRANGEGFYASAIARYLFTPNFGLRLAAEYQDWEANHDGVDTTYFSDGNSAETKLNKANWTSYGFNLGLEYVF